MRTARDCCVWGRGMSRVYVCFWEWGVSRGVCVQVEVCVSRGCVCVSGASVQGVYTSSDPEAHPRTQRQAPPPPVERRNDTRLWKHYLLATTVAGFNNQITVLRDLHILLHWVFSIDLGYSRDYWCKFSSLRVQLHVFWKQPGVKWIFSLNLRLNATYCLKHVKQMRLKMIETAPTSCAIQKTQRAFDIKSIFWEKNINNKEKEKNSQIILAYFKFHIV